MKRLFLLSVVLIACLMSAGCSYMVEFAVINTSSSTIEVEYVLISDYKALDHPTIKPLKTTRPKYDAWFDKKDWVEIPDNEFVYDPSTKKCKLKLAPGEVLRLTFVHDSQVKGEDIDSFGIESVSLNGARGELVYRGKDFYKQSIRQDEHNYYITYK
jgi:hypothetical protein